MTKTNTSGDPIDWQAWKESDGTKPTPPPPTIEDEAREWCEAFKWNNFDDAEKVDEGLVADLAAFARQREASIRSDTVEEAFDEFLERFHKKINAELGEGHERIGFNITLIAKLVTKEMSEQAVAAEMRKGER